MVAPPTEEMIAVVAEAKTGIPWDQLTEEQKAAIYRDYEGEQEVLYAAYEQAVSEQETEMPEGREVGGIFRASNPLETLGAVAQRGVGYKRQQKAEEELAGLSADKAAGSRAAGEVGAYNADRRMALMSEALRGNKEEAPAPAPAPAPTPAPPSVPADPQQPPMASATPYQAPQRPETMMSALLRQVGPGTEGGPAFDPETFMNDYRPTPLTPEEEEERKRRYGRGKSRYHMFGEY